MHDLFQVFQFKVEIDGTAISFKSAKGLKITTAFEPLQVGGMNDGPVLLPVPVKESGRVTFERGKYMGKPKTLPKPGTVLKRIDVLIKGDDDTAIYQLESPVIESLELSALDALSSEVLIETLTVAYSRMEEK